MKKKTKVSKKTRAKETKTKSRLPKVGKKETSQKKPGSVKKKKVVKKSNKTVRALKTSPKTKKSLGKKGVEKKKPRTTAHLSSTSAFVSNLAVSGPTVSNTTMPGTILPPGAAILQSTLQSTLQPTNTVETNTVEIKRGRGRKRGFVEKNTMDDVKTFDLFDSFASEENSSSFKEASGKSKIKNKIVRKKPGTKTINYFDNTTQDAIVLYQNENNIPQKNLIYLESIFPAFDALVENLINVYGFTIAYESRTDLKNECLEFLYTALPKFNAEKGSKAFSYFNVVAKHWLTIKSKQNAKKTQSYISLDNKDAIGNHDMETIERFSVAPDGEELMIGLENKEAVKALLKEVTDRAKTENEKTCVKAINVLISSIDDVDLLNKRAILLYLREITGLSSKQLSIVLASLKKHYKDVKKKEEYC